MILVTPCAAAATGRPGCKLRGGARRELEREAEIVVAQREIDGEVGEVEI